MGAYNSAATGSGNWRYLHADHKGSIIAHSNTSGSQLVALSYDAYGIPGSANSDRFGFTGQSWLKELGLYHYKARMYSPRLGRFLQTDPIYYADQMNMYAYMGNDPVNKIDPTGLQSACANSRADACYSGPADSTNDGAKSAAEARAEAYKAAGMEDPSKPLADAAKKVAETTAEVGKTVEAVAAPSPAVKIGMVGAIAANIKRFMQKIPSNSKANVTTHPLPNGGVAVQAESPGKVPGSSAVYEKQIDANGQTIQATKTTYDPSGNIVHVKDKLTNETYIP